jgi:hypothetical protein
MGITPNDIAAQRAMLARGEAIAAAKNHHAERVRLRDTFAAAALPLCTRNGRNAEQISESAYKLADAMLRERSRTGQSAADTTPQSRAGTPPESYEKSDENRTNTNMNRTIDKMAYEGDIVSRLKNWRGLHLAHGGKLFEEAATEIDRLREAIRRLADQDATLSVEAGNVSVTLDATLTDEEREAIEAAIDRFKDWVNGFDDDERAATLRSLLERLK